MPQRRKIPVRPNEPAKEAELIPVTQTNEHWNEYLLEDGTLVRVKCVASEVWRVLGEFDGDGNPVYVVRSSNLVSVIAPDALRRPE